jgi:uncharacterized protein YcbK (DUF882 family)
MALNPAAKAVLYALPLIPLTVSASIISEELSSPPVLSVRAPAPEPVRAPVVDPTLSSPDSQRPIEKMAAPARETVRVKLANANDADERLEVEIPADGMVDPETADVLEDFFHCRRTARRHEMSAGALSLLADVAKRFPARTIEIISGYRSKPYGAPRSKHFKGNAIDMRVRGVKLSAVRDAMWVSHEHIGLGWYPQSNFIHLDFRPGETEIAWSARGEGSRYRYHPSWAYRARAKASEASKDQLATR